MTSAESYKLTFLKDNGLLEEAKELEARIIKRDLELTKSQRATEQANIVLGTLAKEWLSKIRTCHEPTKQTKKQARKLAKVNDPVLIQGPSGTGKELLARALHGNKEGNFVAINCAGLPEHLIESELFGHVKGAFTGATEKDKQGLFQEAANGTLFLDEMGELPLMLQAKLLRVLQEYKVRKVGSNKEETITCRIVAATHHNLEELVGLHKFRLDLYYRLSTFILQTYPLSDRLDDIPLIANSINPEFPVDSVDWNKVQLQGNVRSLQQVVRRWEVLGEAP